MRRYYVEFAVSMVAYVAVVAVSRRLLEGSAAYASLGVRLAVAGLPVVPVILLFISSVRVIRNTDELNRRICVDSLAIAGGVTALLAVTYGLIEGGPLPHLSAWWTYVVFMLTWLVAQIFVRRQYR